MTVNSKFDICSFKEIIDPLTQENTSIFLILIINPFTLNLSKIIDAKHQELYMRFFSTKNPYTYDMKQIFNEIGGFIVSILREIQEGEGIILNEYN